MEEVFVKSGYGLIQMGHRSNYDWMLFLASPMTFAYHQYEYNYYYN